MRSTIWNPRGSCRRLAIGWRNRAGDVPSIKLRSGLKPGEEFAIEIKLRGIDEPAPIAKAIVIAGPRPRITAVRKSSADDASIALRPGEVPAGSPVSFELSVEHLD